MHTLGKKYIAELEIFMKDLSDSLQMSVIKNYHRLCSDYLSSSKPLKKGEYNHVVSTAFIVKTREWGQTPFIMEKCVIIY